MLLVLNRPRAPSKRELHEAIWPATFVTDDSLARLVTEIRTAIGDDARDARFVRTVYGFGYAFTDSATAKRDAGRVNIVLNSFEDLKARAPTK